MTQFKHRHVVSNFVFKTEGTTSLVALFRRSKQVRTYRGKLAPISGTKEEGEKPFDAAVRELGEETGLQLHQDYGIYLIGKAFNITDESIHRSWTVHPFSWTLKGSSEPDFNLDWEHTGWCWNEPREVLSGELDRDSVPNLAESLRRVWLSDSAIFEPWQIQNSQAVTLLWSALGSLRDDHDSGASYMACLALKYFQRVVTDFVPHTLHEKYWQQLQMIAWHIINNGRPSMNAAVMHALLSVMRSIKGCHDRPRIVEQIEAAVIARAAMCNLIVQSFVSYVDRLVERRKRSGSVKHPHKISILTLSASIIKSAILGVLRQLPDIEIDLRVMESRPLCEGAQMAAKLMQKISKSEENRLQVTIATDASVAILAQATDMVLLGADRISRNGDVSNKTGSFAAALCARAVGNRSPDTITPKVVILSGTEKIAKSEKLDDHAIEDNSSSQVWRVWELAGCKQAGILLQNNTRVFFKNVFFEWVPTGYIDSYITEYGEWSTEQIQQQSSHIEKLEAELFDF